MKLTVYNSWLEWTLLTALALCSEYGAGQTAVLLRAASVSRDSIRLSDLLPPDTSIEMRRAGEQIELGRTPQCHTIRFFEPPDIEKRTFSSPALRGLTFSGPVSVQRACFPIRREAVQHAISAFTQQKDLALAESPWSETIYASQDNPALEVELAFFDPARQASQIRLRCVERTVCPSFWVAVPAGQRPHLLSRAAFSAVAAAHATIKDATLVEFGQRVMLILEDPPMRIQLPVTCLQRGSLGKQVRAMDPSTHRVFRAEVTDAGTLRAHL
ncbi:MAG: flagella basal body P-ring formation protein FlgA [Terriglobales bacterium]